MMRGTAAVLFTMALFAAGCGGSQIAADEVSVEPPTLTIPKDSKLVGQTRAGASPTATATSTATAAAGAAGGATTAPATGGATTGNAGGAATPAPTQSGANTGGAAADQDFDEFCANNPGAC